MGLFDYMNISATALTAEKTRMDIISENIANSKTTRTAGGTPYRRKIPVFREYKKSPFEHILGEKLGKNDFKGVKVSRIKEDPSEFVSVYEPGHPDADKEGYVLMPNVSVVKEMVDMISAQRAYDSNITAISTAKAMMTKALEITGR